MSILVFCIGCKPDKPIKNYQLTIVYLAPIGKEGDDFPKIIEELCIPIKTTEECPHNFACNPVLVKRIDNNSEKRMAIQIDEKNSNTKNLNLWANWIEAYFNTNKIDDDLSEVLNFEVNKKAVIDSLTASTGRKARTLYYSEKPREEEYDGEKLYFDIDSLEAKIALILEEGESSNLFVIVNPESAAKKVEQLKIMPLKNDISPNEKVRFKASGGSPPYSWSAKGSTSEDGNGELHEVRYIEAGLYAIQVTDALGQMNEKKIIVQGKLDPKPELTEQQGPCNPNNAINVKMKYDEKNGLVSWQENQCIEGVAFTMTKVSGSCPSLNKTFDKGPDSGIRTLLLDGSYATATCLFDIRMIAYDSQGKELKLTGNVVRGKKAKCS